MLPGSHSVQSVMLAREGCVTLGTLSTAVWSSVYDKFHRKPPAYGLPVRVQRGWSQVRPVIGERLSTAVATLVILRMAPGVQV